MSTVAEVEALLKARDEISAKLKKVQENTATETGKIRGHFDNMAKKMGEVGSSMTKKVTLPIVAGFTLALKAGAEEQQQMETLAKVIRTQIPGATQEAIDKNEEWITSIQNTTGVADGELREMEQKFLAAGASIEDSQRMAAIAIDTSVATGKELNSVADAMVKGVNGQTAGFSRLGVQVRNADGSMKSFDQILQDLEKHQGTAAAGMDTAAGRAQIMKLKMADLTEDIGMILIPILDKLTGWLSKIVDWFNNLSPGAKEAGVAILGIAAAVGPLLVVGDKLIKMFGNIAGAATKLFAFLMAHPFVAIGAAVVALVILIVMNWDKIKEFLGKVWEGIKNVAGVVWNGIKNAIKGVVDFLVTLFMNFTLPGLIMKHWETIKAGVSNVTGFIQTTWNNLVTFFKGIPNRIGGFFTGMWDGLKAAAKTAFNFIADAWNNTVGKIQFTVPSWVPGLGGKGFKMPQIPRMHEGGIVPGPLGKEVPIIALAGERVTPIGGGGTNFHITMEGTGIPAVDAQRMAAMASVLRRMESAA